MAKKLREKKIQRKIFFYQVKCACDGTSIPLSDVFEAYIDIWKNKNDDLINRGLAISHYDKYHFLDIRKDIDDSDVYLGRFFSLRSNDFPYLFNVDNGSQTQISAAINDTLMEQTHFICIPKQCLIVSEFNFNGAKIEHLARYLSSVLGNKIISKHYTINIIPIIMPEFYKNILKCKNIKSFEFKVATPGLTFLHDEGVINGLDIAQGNISSDDDYYTDIAISSVKRGGDLSVNEPASLLQKMVNAISKGLNRDINRADGCEPTFKKAKLKAFNRDEGRVIPYDLLEEKLVQYEWVEKISPKAKYVDTIKMFQALKTAYRDKRDDACNFMGVTENAPHEQLAV
jgi:hypothetical protein